MASKQTQELKKKLEESQKKDIKIAWQHLNWEWRIILILGLITLAYLLVPASFKFGQWLADYFILAP